MKNTEHIRQALARIKQFPPERGYYLAFSGGKDSIVCYHLLKEAGVPFDAHFHITTVDPPEVIRFVREHYPDVQFDKPETTMWKLIPHKKMPPTRIARYCCEVFKEGHGDFRFVVTGVRWAESVRRKLNREEIEYDAYGSRGKRAIQNRKIFKHADNDTRRRMLENCAIIGKHILNPIIDWTDDQVWEFIHERSLAYPVLYDQGFHRIGCIGCPMGRKQGMERDFERYPKYKVAYLRAFQRLIDKGECTWNTPEEVMDWWMQVNKDGEGESEW